MSGSAISELGKCLRESRRAAGYSNYGQAGLATNRSPEVVGRHERGDVTVQMVDAIEYADAYGHPEIMMTYCDQCAIRNRLFGGERHTGFGLPLTVIRLSNRLRSADQHADRLEQILDDGRIDQEDEEALTETLDFLKEIESVWRELLSSCMKAGFVDMKKPPCRGKQAGSHQNHLSQQP